MTHHRSGAIRGTVAVGTLLVVVFLAAGFGVSRLFDHNQRVSSSATDSAVISEQVHVLAVVASQSAVEGADLPALRRTGLEAGIKAKATVDELLRRGLLRSQVEELARRLTEYYAGLAVADQLFAQQDQLAARRMAADTAVMVQPISDLARELRTSLQQEARSTARVVELALRAIVLGVAVGIIAFMTIVGHRRRRLAVRAADRAARADSAEELAEVNRVLRTVTAADAALVHALDEAELFEQMCRLVVDVGGYPMAAIAIADPTHPTGLRTIARVQSRPGHEMVLTTEVHDAIDTRTRRVITADKLATTDYVAAVLPLYNADVTVGALVIAARAEGGFSDEELTLLDSLADNVGFGTGALRMREERQRYLQRVERSFDSLVGVVATTVEYRDPYTAGHQRSVGELAGAIAAELGVASEDIEGIETAAAIHDIGKVAIPAEILAKPAKLNAIEFELIKGHCAVGAEILKAIDFPWPVATMVLQHHERMDGSGYPSGLAGEDILLGARIIGVADTIDAMSTHRPYRPSLGLDAALGVILDGRGSRFDPDVVDACLKVLRREPFASKWPQALTG